MAYEDAIKYLEKHPGAKYDTKRSGWIVDGGVDLSNMGLTRLPKFISVSGYFDCSGNQIFSLAGCPTSVGRDFYCSNSQLTSLDGAPKSHIGIWAEYRNCDKDYLVGRPIKTPHGLGIIIKCLINIRGKKENNSFEIKLFSGKTQKFLENICKIL
jgi:hypothetical protein